MLSRTAASLYWLGRYIERAEFTARLVEATVRLDAMSARPAGEGAWASALAVVTAQTAFDAEGLPVSQKIVREHGGEIRVASEPGHGSRFTLQWPAPAPDSLNDLAALPTDYDLPAIPTDELTGDEFGGAAQFG